MLNRVILMGRLVADPELKHTTSGVAVTSFRIAVDRSYVKQGEARQTDFFDIVAWRSSAEFVCRNFSKGSLIAIDGQLQSRQYQTKDGQNRTAIEVVADNVSFTGERRDNSDSYGYGGEQAYRGNDYGSQVPAAPAAQPQYQQPQRNAPAQPSAQPQYQQSQFNGYDGYTADGDLPF